MINIVFKSLLICLFSKGSEKRWKGIMRKLDPQQGKSRERGYIFTDIDPFPAVGVLLLPAKNNQVKVIPKTFPFVLS